MLAEDEEKVTEDESGTQEQDQPETQEPLTTVSEVATPGRVITCEEDIFLASNYTVITIH